MADTTSSALSSLYPLVYEPSELALRAATPILESVTQYDDMLGKGIATRTMSQMALVTAAAVAENADLSSTTYTKSSTATLTPAEAGAQIVLTDRAVDTDQNLAGNAGKELGRAVGTKVDADIAALFSSFTGGTVGASNAALTFQKLFAGREILRNAGVYDDLWAVIHPYQWFALANSVSLEQTIKNTPEVVREELVRDFYMGSIAGMHILMDSNIALAGNGGTQNAVGGIYPSMSMAFDVRRSYKVEEFRSPKGRKTEFNASIDYAVGVAYPARGVQVASLAVTPA